MNATETSSRPQPGPLSETEGAKPALTLLREWQSVCDAVAAGTNHVLIRKGGIAEGREGFQVRKSFFGLLPTLFHQVKSHDPAAETPEPPHKVELVCQLADAYSVASTIDLSSLAGYHAYDADQLAARQHYKTERPLSLIIIRPFKLRAPIEFPAEQVKAVCRSWVDLPLNAGMGGIEPIAEPAKLDPTLDDLRKLIEALPDVQRLNV